MLIKYRFHDTNFVPTWSPTFHVQKPGYTCMKNRKESKKHLSGKNIKTKGNSDVIKLRDGVLPCGLFLLLLFVGQVHQIRSRTEMETRVYPFTFIVLRCLLILTAPMVSHRI